MTDAEVVALEKNQETAPATEEGQSSGRKPRSDRGLPKRKSLLLSRAASARFTRVAAELKGGEEELAALLEPWIDKLFGGELAYNEAGEADSLEELALAGVAARMKGEAAT